MHVKVVLADRQFALQLNNQPGTRPSTDQLVLLTAVIADENDDPVPEGTPVYWGAPNLNDGTFVFYQADSDGNPVIISDSSEPGYPSPNTNTATSRTNDKGQAVILAGSFNRTIGTINASLSREFKTLQLPHPLGGPNYQNVAICTFDNEGTLLEPVGLEKNLSGDISLPTVDGDQNPAPLEWGGPIDNGPIFSKNKYGAEPVKDSLYIVWACSGSDESGVGQIVQPPQHWDGGPLDVKIPYGIFSRRNNKLAYMFFGAGTPLYSQVLNFDFDGVPLARPDDVDSNFDQSLAPMMFVEPRNDPLTGKPVVQEMPDQLGFNDFSDKKRLTFAIPAPMDENGNDAHKKGDVIAVKFYMNGWDATKPTYLQSKIYSFDHLTGADFQENYDTKGKTYLPLFLTISDCTGFGPNGNTQKPGYFWVQYVYNDHLSLLPSPPVRINFPGPRPPKLEADKGNSSGSL